MQNKDYKADLEQAKKEALYLLKEFAYEEPPVLVHIMVQELGVALRVGKFGDEYPNISGLFSVEENAIYVNAKEPGKRQIWTVAHELGHQRLHARLLQSSDCTVLLHDRMIITDDPLEQEANAFAAHLMAPKFMLDEYVGFSPIETISNIFTIPETIIRRRIRDEYK